MSKSVCKCAPPREGGWGVWGHAFLENFTDSRSSEMGFSESV